MVAIYDPYPLGPKWFLLLLAVSVIAQSYVQSMQEAISRSQQSRQEARDRGQSRRKPNNYDGQSLQEAKIGGLV